MWPFNYFKKRREARLKAEAEKQAEYLRREKERYAARKTYIQNHIEALEKLESAKRIAYRDVYNKEAREHNSVCPMCKHKNVYQVFSRPKGEVKGFLDGNSSYSPSLFGGHYYSRVKGKLDGQFDTLKVNKCGDCNHEWVHQEEKDIIYCSDYYPNKVDYSVGVPYLIEDIMDAMESLEEFDPTLLSEECHTVEEKEAALIDKIKGRSWYRNASNLSIEVLHYYTSRYSYHISRKCAESALVRYHSDDVDEYMGTFTPKWEKFLMEKLGFKKHFNEEM